MFLKMVIPNIPIIKLLSGSIATQQLLSTNNYLLDICPSIHLDTGTTLTAVFEVVTLL